MPIADDFFLTNLELRESTETGDVASGLSHASMKGMVLLSVLELAARGEPKGAVTVLHDAGDTGERYKELAVALAEAGWAVALPDLRGHGRTEGERGHSTGLLEVRRDVQEILDHLAYRMPDEPKVLVGVGLGALYAAHFADEARGALAALVLVGPLHGPRFERPAAPKGLGKLFKKVGPTSAGATGLRGEHLTADPDEARAFDADELTHGAITLRAIEEAERATAALGRLGELGVPVLVVHGADDPVSDVEASRALGGGPVEVLVVDGARHHPLNGAAGARARAEVAAWIDSHAAG